MFGWNFVLSGWFFTLGRFFFLVSVYCYEMEGELETWKAKTTHWLGLDALEFSSFGLVYFRFLSCLGFKCTHQFFQYHYFRQWLVMTNTECMPYLQEATRGSVVYLRHRVISKSPEQPFCGLTYSIIWLLLRTPYMFKRFQQYLALYSVLVRQSMK